MLAPPGSFLDRHPRWKGPLVVGGVVAAVVGIAWVAVYAPMPNLVPAPLHGTPFLFTTVVAVTDAGNASGPGGCVAPGPGATEYCYESRLAWAEPPLGPLNFTGPATYQLANTSEVSFVVTDPSTDVGVRFVNVTLLGPSGQLLAGYASATGWTAYSPTQLPFVIEANDTVVLNFGSHSGNGDELLAFEGAWGSTAALLP